MGADGLALAISFFPRKTPNPGLMVGIFYVECFADFELQSNRRKFQIEEISLA